MSDGAVGPPDPGTVRRYREREAKAAPLRQMLQEHCRFKFKNGAEVRQRRIKEHPILGRFIVVRPDGEEAEFRPGQEVLAHDFAHGKVDLSKKKKHQPDSGNRVF